MNGIVKVAPDNNSQFFFISLLAVVGITVIGFFPLYGVNGLFIKNLLLPIFAGLLLIVIAIQSLKNGAFALPDKKTSWTILFFLVVMLASALFASSPRNALFGTLGETPSFAILFSLVIIFYIASQTMKKFSHLLGLLFVASVGYMIAFLHVILRLIFGSSFLSFGFFNSFTSSLLGSWTDFALFSLLMVILSVICLEMGKFVRLAKWIAFTVGILGIIGLFLANIPWIWILAGAVLIIICIYIFSLAYWNPEKSLYEKGRPAPWYSLAALIIVLSGFLFGGVIISPISNIRSLGYNEIYPNVMATARAGWASIHENPIIGSGVSGFDHVWNKIKPVSLSGTESGSFEFSTGYSFITTLLATTGILGIIAILLVIVAVIRQYVILYKKGFRDSSHRFTGALVIGGSVLLSVITIVDYPGTSLLVLWAVFLGALWSLAHEDDDHIVEFTNNPKTSLMGIIAVIVLIFVGGAFIYITVRQIASVRSYSSAVKSFSKNDQSTGLQHLTIANQLWPTDFYNRTLANQVLTQVQTLKPDQNMAKDALAREVQRVLSIAMSYADISTKLDPKNYRNWIVLGNVYQFFTTLNVEGAADRAKDAYTKAQQLSPNDRTLDLISADLSLAQGNTDAAKTLVQQSIEKYPTTNAYIWLYGQDVQAKNYADAEKQLVNALGINNSNVAVLTELGTLYFVQGKYSDAVPVFERSLSLNRNQPATFAYLGVSYEAVGKTDQANQVFDFLKKQLPDSADKLISKVREQKGGAVTPVVENQTDTTAPAASAETKKPATTPTKPKQ